MPYPKPYLTVSQQLALLQQRGMIIPNHSKANQCLERIGYYRLSAYWFPFRTVDNSGNITDTFKPNTSFETVINLYYFDKNLRMVTLDIVERIEIALRGHIASLLGAKSPLAHRDPQMLDGKFARKRNKKTQKIPHQDWLDQIDKEFGRSKEEFAKHFKSKYPQDKPPIWIACEVWSFGSLSRLYGGLTTADQNSIARIFSIPNGRILEGWIRTLNDARNVCAHHSRIWNSTIGLQPSWPTPNQVPDLGHIASNVKAQTRIYGTLSILRYLLRSVNPATQWSSRVKQICQTFPVDPSLSLSSGGFPNSWLQEKLWA